MKCILFLIFRISLDGRVEADLLIRRPVPTEGRLAIVTNAGRDAVDADGAFDEWRYRGRRSRVVLMPRRWHQVGGGNSVNDGGKQARSQEREGNR